MNVEPEPGVYKLTCQTTGRFYVGQSVNVKQRVRDHFSKLRNDRHGNSYLQHVWSKHQALVVESVIYCPREELDELEQLCIDTANQDLLMNICKDISMTAGIIPGPRPDSVKAKISTTKSGKPLAQATREGYLKWCKDLVTITATSQDTSIIINGWLEASELLGVNVETLRSAARRGTLCDKKWAISAHRGTKS